MLIFNIFCILFVFQEHLTEYSEICHLAKPPVSATVSSEAAVVNSPSILKKDSRLSRLNTWGFGESQTRVKGSPSRRIRNSAYMSLRFAADVK